MRDESKVKMGKGESFELEFLKRYKVHLETRRVSLFSSCPLFFNQLRFHGGKNSRNDAAFSEVVRL